MSTLNRYLARRVMTSIFVAFFVISGIIMLVDFVEASRNIGSDTEASMLTILYVTLLNAPTLVEQTIPFVVLFGVMGALFTLNRRSELIVLRASGLSAWTFLRPVMMVTAVLGVLWATIFNPLASLSQDKYASVLRALSSDPNIETVVNKPIWLREGDDDGFVVIHALSADIDNHILYDVTLYNFDFITDKTAPIKRAVFSSRYDAKKAVLSSGKFWELTDVIENEDDKAPQTFATISRTTSISWDILRERSQARENPPFWRIRGEINKAKQAGFDATPLIMQLHKLLALPLALISMAVIAAGASLNMARAGGTLKLLIAGGAMGFGVYFVDNLIGAFGETGTLPPAVAAWAVPLLVLSCGLVYLSWIEDG